jgi:acyl transferase domain-containing protein
MNLEERISRLSPAQLAVLARELEARERSVHREPIAIVGIGCRMPGNIHGPGAFWEALLGGCDLRTEVPRERWDASTFYDSDPERAARAYVREGYFIGEHDRFDPGFFGIAMREAKTMDPQQRLLLEVVWEAIENAGYAPTSLYESDTGVFVGLYGDEYLHLQLWGANLAEIDAHASTGTSHSIAVGRVSHLLGLRGPSMAIDTACSASLVAVHLAAQSLGNRECSVALAGGVSLALSPETPIILSRARMLSPDGRCKTFDASADGYGRGEGCGIVVLKRLSDALAARDRIAAVIRGSAVNHDGRSSTLTAPNGPAQVAVIRRALAAAGLAPDAIDYVEAHGTGTPLGDPVEVEALGEVFGNRGIRVPLGIGSVKTNVGHLEAAAGVAGLIKLALSLENEELPPHLHLRQVNPHIELERLPIQVLTERTPWPRGARERFAGVSSFGFGGTNAHVVLGEGPRPAAPSAPDEPGGRVLLLSGRTEEELRETAMCYMDALADVSGDLIDDVCFTANVGRVHRSCRLAVNSPSLEAAIEGLGAFVHGQASASWKYHRADAPPRVAFLFTGQGSQYPGMGLLQAPRRCS